LFEIDFITNKSPFNHSVIKHAVLASKTGIVRNFMKTSKNEHKNKHTVHNHSFLGNNRSAKPIYYKNQLVDLNFIIFDQILTAET